MIRINLLTVDRGRVGKSRVLISPAHRVTIGAVLIVLTTAFGVGWWFWTLRQASARLTEDIARAEVEAQQLRAVLAQVQKFEARKAQLQQRVTLIERLRKNQGAPVRVLDGISRSLPDRLWLTDLKQTGSDFVIGGLATSLTAVSDFMANLEETKSFRKPVEIVDNKLEPNAKTGDLIKFSIKASFNDPDAPPAPRPGAKAPPGPGAARGAR